MHCFLVKTVYFNKDHIFCARECVLHHRWSAERVDLYWNITVLYFEFPCAKERVEPVFEGAELHCNSHAVLYSILKDTPFEIAEYCVEQLAMVQGVMPHKRHV